jgi:hypothetical protein
MASEKRLIDANALICQLYNTASTTQDPYDDIKKFYHESGFNSGMVAASTIVAKAPTVEAVEVIHAHWEDGCAVDPKTGRIIYKSIDCSHCEEIFKIESHDREYWKKRFKVCPFCGAVMDGGNEDV